MGMSDIIENYIKELFEATSEVQLKRNDLAVKFNCVPSQINYVIATRFTNERGFIVESKRGGGGGITIRKIYFKENDYFAHLINSIGDTLRQSEAFSYIKRLYEYNLIDEREANIMFAAVSDTTLNILGNLKDHLRASIFKNMIINLRRTREE